MDKKSKHYWYNSIKLKLMIMMISISIIPLLFLGLYNIKFVKLEVEKSIHKEHSIAVTRISQAVKELVNTLRISLETIGLTNLEMFNEDSEENVENIVYGILRGFSHLEEASIVLPDGSEIVKVSKRHAICPDESYSIFNKKKLDSLRLGDVYIGRPKIDEDNQIIFDLIVPTIIGENEFIGAIKTKVSLRQVMQEITAMDILQGSYIMLIDEEGSLIGHSDYSQVLRRQDVKSSKGVEILLESKVNQSDNFGPREFNVIPYTSYTGEDVLGVYGRIPIVDWGVVVEQPLVNAYEGLISMMYRLNTILIGILVIISVIGTIFIFKFIKPVEELAKGVASVKEGNLDYKIPKQGNDEIGVVIEAFNDMIDEIKKKRENESLTMLAEKRAAIGTLAAGVAHEINNPMNNLGFYATDLIERLELEDINKLYEDGTLGEYLETIREQIERCSDITQNLLKFSRKSRFEIKPIKISEVVKDVLKLIDHRLRKQNISVLADLKDLEPFALADEPQMQQVILNIITNSVDEMPNGGNLQIMIEEDSSEVDILILRIIDNGQGIRAKNIVRIFDPFYTTKPLGKGTGLGLSISQAIIERMRGSIDIVSEYNHGTEVIVRLPIFREVT